MYNILYAIIFILNVCMVLEMEPRSFYHWTTSPAVLIFCLEMGVLLSCQGQPWTCWSWPPTCDTSALASKVAGITGIYHYTRSCDIFKKWAKVVWPSSYLPIAPLPSLGEYNQDWVLMRPSGLLHTDDTPHCGQEEVHVKQADLASEFLMKEPGNLHFIKQVPQVIICSQKFERFSWEEHWVGRSKF